MIFFLVCCSFMILLPDSIVRFYNYLIAQYNYMLTK